MPSRSPLRHARVYNIRHLEGSRGSQAAVLHPLSRLARVQAAMAVGWAEFRAEDSATQEAVDTVSRSAPDIEQPKSKLNTRERRPPQEPRSVPSASSPPQTR